MLRLVNRELLMRRTCFRVFSTVSVPKVVVQISVTFNRK